MPGQVPLILLIELVFCNYNDSMLRFLAVSFSYHLHSSALNAFARGMTIYQGMSMMGTVEDWARRIKYCPEIMEGIQKGFPV